MLQFSRGIPEIPPNPYSLRNCYLLQHDHVNVPFTNHLWNIVFLLFYSRRCAYFRLSFLSPVQKYEFVTCPISSIHFYLCYFWMSARQTSNTFYFYWHIRWSIFTVRRYLMWRAQRRTAHLISSPEHPTFGVVETRNHHHHHRPKNRFQLRWSYTATIYL